MKEPHHGKLFITYWKERNPPLVTKATVDAQESSDASYFEAALLHNNFSPSLLPLSCILEDSF